MRASLFDKMNKPIKVNRLPLNERNSCYTNKATGLDFKRQLMQFHKLFINTPLSIIISVLLFNPGHCLENKTN